jgi:hypothetical protein
VTSAVLRGRRCHACTRYCDSLTAAADFAVENVDASGGRRARRRSWGRPGPAEHRGLHRTRPVGADHGGVRPRRGARRLPAHPAPSDHTPQLDGTEAAAGTANACGVYRLTGVTLPPKATPYVLRVRSNAAGAAQTLPSLVRQGADRHRCARGPAADAPEPDASGRPCTPAGGVPGGRGRAAADPRLAVGIVTSESARAGRAGRLALCAGLPGRLSVRLTPTSRPRLTLTSRTRRRPCRRL